MDTNLDRLMERITGLRMSPPMAAKGGGKGDGPNLPSKTGNPSGGGRGNNPPKR